jgi:hypothetical protein
MIGGHSLEKGFRSRFLVAVQQDAPLVTHDADIHGAGLQVDTTVKTVLVGVEALEIL